MCPSADINLLTIVIEDIFSTSPLSRVLSKAITGTDLSGALNPTPAWLLILLDEFGASATYFVLGYIADEMPDILGEVVGRGHEVASKCYHYRSLQ